MTPGDIVTIVLAVAFLVGFAPLMVRFKGDKR